MILHLFPSCILAHWKTFPIVYSLFVGIVNTSTYKHQIHLLRQEKNIVAYNETSLTIVIISLFLSPYSCFGKRNICCSFTHKWAAPSTFPGGQVLDVLSTTSHF